MTVTKQEKARESRRKWVEKNHDKQLLMVREWKKENIDKVREYISTYKKRHPKRNSAHSMVAWALKEGKITQKPCKECGELMVEAHHEDYNKPLDVIWLCEKHHKELHRQRKEK